MPITSSKMTLSPLSKFPFLWLSPTYGEPIDDKNIVAYHFPYPFCAWKKLGYLDWGGRSAHPWIMAIGGCFHYFLLARALSLDVKGQNLKAQPSTSKDIALRALGKIAIFCKIWKKWKIRYFETRLFVEKNAVKIEPRHIGCSFFLEKDRNGHTWKVNQSRHVFVKRK